MFIDTQLGTNLPNFLHRGKVRDTYLIDDKTLLMVATDRISAFDVVLPTGIPSKGKVLNRISAFWFDKTKHIVPNHLICLADSPEAAVRYGGNELIDNLYLPYQNNLESFRKILLFFRKSILENDVISEKFVFSIF